MPSARRVNWAKTRVTCVCVAATIILLTLFYLLTGGTLLQPKALLYLYIPDATGLGPGSPVRVDGMGVGEVDTVELARSRDPNRIIKLTLKVERDRLPSISDDSTTEISNDTLIGDKFVDVSSGTSPGHVMPNGELKLKTATVFVKRIDITQFEQQLRNIDALLADIERGQSEIGKLILGEQMYNDLLNRLTQAERAFRKAVATSNEVGSVLYTTALYRKITDPILQIDQTLARMQRTSFLSDAAQFDQLRSSIASMRKTIADTKAGSWMQTETAYQGWTRNVNSLIQKVDEVNANSLLNSSDLYERLNGFAKETGNAVRDFRENPRKYLRLKVF